MAPLRTHRYRPALLWLLLVLALMPIFYLHMTAIRAADDFYYATFWQSGLAEFWRLTLHHYEAFNGRALVHFVAQTVLAFPPLVFATLNTALLVVLSYFGSTVQGAAPHDHARLRSVCVFFPLLLLLPTGLFAEGLLWASASYNYMLPVVLTLLALWLLTRFFAAGTKRPAFYILFALASFAAGATTEQSGFMAVAVLGTYGLCRLVSTRKGWWRLIPAPLLAAVGCLTVFLSPATQRRAAKGASLEWDTLALHLRRMGDALFSLDGLLLPLLAAVLLLAACLVVPKARRQLSCATPALLVGGLASVLIMLPTGTFSPRVLLPMALLSLVVAAQCGSVLLGLFREDSYQPALWIWGVLLLSLVVRTPLLVGATGNYALELRNHAAVEEARESGVLRYCMDYDTRWCYASLMFSENSFYTRFLQTNGVQDSTVYLESAHMEPVYLNGAQLTSPAFHQNGKVFFSLRDIVDGFGGRVEYDMGSFLVTLDEQEVKIWPYPIASHYPGGIYAEVDLTGKAATRYYTAAYTADVFEALFGVEITLVDGRYLCRR